MTRIDLPFERPGFAVWSPDGARIAIGGAPRLAVPVFGPARTELPRALFIYFMRDKTMTTIGRDLHDLSTMNWSPDSRWLTLTMRVGDAPDGLWLVDAATGQRQLLLQTDDIAGVIWLPGGQTMVAAVGRSARRRTGYDGPDGLYVFTLPDALLAAPAR